MAGKQQVDLSYSFRTGGEKGAALELWLSGQKLTSIHIIINKTLHLQAFTELLKPPGNALRV